MTLPTIILPGYLAGSADYQPLVTELDRRGVRSVCVPLRWWEWLPTVGGRSVVPILDRLDQTVQDLRRATGKDQVILVGHSAGGWLSRIYLGDQPYYDRVWQAHRWVNQLVTLGTPHESREPWTKNNLGFVNSCYPGAFYRHIRYVCVAGRSVYGEQNWLTYQSYLLTVGEGKTWGDGITPIGAAHLEGAENIVLEGARHSPQKTPWYGTPHLLDQWIGVLTTS